jgi:regulator of protease activity HflC (stomatin/prohibitin superfamily)
VENLVILAVLLVIVLWFIRSTVRVVQQYQRLVVLFFGKYQGTWLPGLRILLPVLQQAFTVDLREKVKEIPQQTCITKDNAPINIDFLIYSKIVDAERSVLEVQNFNQAVEGIASTTSLRAASRSTKSCASSSTRSPSAGASRSPPWRSGRSSRHGTSRTR